MATITLEYNARNRMAQKTLEFILSLGVFRTKTPKTVLEQAFEDIDKGRVTFVNGPGKKTVGDGGGKDKAQDG
ncbi:MAG: hypothetical protein LBE91_11740 [Tannerella sp.]|jgi:hypothetical protein|nr:hypothetical protein [Tannerella sp.]